MAGAPAVGFLIWSVVSGQWAVGRKPTTPLIVAALTQRDGKRTIVGMALESDSESLPDDADEDQALLNARVLKFLDMFDDVMAAIHGLKGPQEIRQAKVWVLEIVDQLADILEPGIDADSEHLVDAEAPAPVDGPDPAGLPGDIDEMADIFEDDALDAKVDRYLADLAEDVQALPEDHPMRFICKMLQRGSSLLHKARDVKKARDEFQAGLGLPPVP